MIETTILSLLMNGTDNSTAFVDSSPYTRTVTAHGDAHITTDQGMSGGASMWATGLSDYVEIAHNSDLTFLEGHWRISFDFRYASDGTIYRCIASKFDGASQVGWYIDYQPIEDDPSMGQLTFMCQSDSSMTQALFFYTDLALLSANTWVNIKIEYIAGIAAIYINDVLKELTTLTNTYTGFSNTENLKIGTGNGEPLQGWIDNFKIEVITEVGIIVAINDSIDLSEYVLHMFTGYPSVTDSIDSSDSHIVNWNGTKTVSDQIVLADSNILNRLLPDVGIVDSIYMRDSIVIELAIIVQDALALTDSAAAMLCLMITDYLNAVDSHVVNWNGTQSVTDRLSLLDSIRTGLQLSILDSLTISDTTAIELWISVFGYLGFYDLATTIGNFNLGVSDTINTDDSAQFGYNQVISDALAMIDSASVIGMLLNSITESLVLTDAASNQLNATIPVSDTMTITDTVSSQGILYNIVYDTLGMNLTVELDDEVWECYVLNTPKFLPSIYSGFNFNSYCVFENRAYGCKSDGIYELTGDTDNGVTFHTGVQLSETKFGSPNQKRFRKAYVGVSGNQSIMVMETEDGLRKAYSIDSDGEVDASRTLRSKKWKLSVVDFDQLDFIKLIPVVLSK